MFIVYEPFPLGWNRVTIKKVEIRTIGTEKVIALFVRNKDGAEKMFYIFLNNEALLKSLVLQTIGSEGLNRKIEEEELTGKTIMIFLQPKATYQIIITIMGCDDVESEEYYDLSNDIF